MKEIGLLKSIFEKAKAWNDAGPAPAAVAGGEHFDFEDVAGLRAFNPDGTGEGVNAGAVDLEKFRGRHAGMHLSAARVHALDLHLVAGLDAEARLEGAVPDGVSWLGCE